MDDDVPLAALAARAPAKTLKLDDDTPLSTLAVAKAGADKKKAAVGAPKPRPSGGGAGAAGAVKAKPKPGTKKKKDGSSSSSSSSDSSSSSSEERKKKKKKAAAARPAAKKKVGGSVLKKRQSEGDMDGDDNENPENNKVNKKKRTQKEELVAKLLCRWWFSTPYQKTDWPPQDESYYIAELTKNKLRKVSIQEWEWVPEEDDQGRKKVYELSQFRGVFRNSAGVLVDMRPKDTCPCFSVFIQKDTLVLCDMLLSAYENQLKELTAVSKYDVVGITGQIKKEMVRWREYHSKMLSHPEWRNR